MKRQHLLAGLFLLAALGLLLVVRAVLSPGVRPGGPDADAVRPLEVAWTFEAPRRGSIVSTPAVAGGRVYFAAIQDGGLFSSGAVYALDRHTGRPAWKFDDGGRMLHMFSSACVADGRLYVGEGMHQNFVCKLYCLDAATGVKLWHFEAGGHIESTPCVAGGRVYFGAGDDGLYCLDAATGKEVWHFQEPCHVDSSPAVVAGRLYAGSGVSLTYSHTEAFCLDSATGAVLWRWPADLPVWGSPAADGGAVFFGLGNGRLLEPPAPPAKPAGGAVCFEAATGRPLWRRAGDAVFGRPAVDANCIYCGSRDGACLCLERRSGEELWRTDLGSPVVARPAVLGPHVYAVSSAGRVCRLDAGSGRVRAVFDLAARTQTRPQVFSSPTVVPDEGGGRRVYLGTELANASTSAAVLYCFRDGGGP
jgi:outer membrane protein assembly factor BamB